MLAEISPAADYGCAFTRETGCRNPACRPDSRPCPNFEGMDEDHWCPCCGWARWAHLPAPSAGVSVPDEEDPRA